MSTYISGNGSQSWVKEETSFGSGMPAAGDATLLNMTSESMSATYNLLEEETLIGAKTQPDQDLGSITASGSVSTILNPSMSDWVFKTALGKVQDILNPADPDTPEGAYTDDYDSHFDGQVFTLADVDEDIPSSAMKLIRGTQRFEYNGLTIRTLTLNCTAQDYVTCDIDFAGLDEVTVDKPYSDSWLSDRPDAPTHGSYKCTQARLFATTANSDTIADFPFSWGACSADVLHKVWDVENTVLTLDNGIEDTPATYCSGLYANRPVKGQRTLTVQCNVPYSESFADFRKTYYANENAEKLALLLAFCSKEKTDWGSGPVPSEQVFVIIPNVRFTNAGANVGGQGLIDASFEGRAVSVGSTEPVKVIVRHSLV